MEPSLRLDQFIKNLTEPFIIGKCIYFLSDYFAFEDVNSTDGKYKISYYSRPHDYVRISLIRQLFDILNDLGIFPSQIRYLIPKNTCNKEYFPYRISYEGADFIYVNDQYDAFVVNLFIENYIDFYDSRYRKAPMFSLNDKSKKIEFKFIWVTEVYLG